jgi:hypothetical protein
MCTNTCEWYWYAGGEASPGLGSRCRGPACVLWRRSGEASADRRPGIWCGRGAGAAASDTSCEMLPLDPHLRAVPYAKETVRVDSRMA